MKRKQQWCIRFSAILLLFCLFTQLIPMASAKRFTDVTRAAFPDYFDAINYVVDNGIMNGVSNTEFEPNSRVTRAMFITTLHRFAGTPADYISMPFNDVPSGHWAYNAIRWGVKNQIVSGTSATTFSPNEYVTREQAMTFYWRFLKDYQHVTPFYADQVTGCNDYTSVSNYARSSMRWAVSNGIIFTGTSPAMLYPKSQVYRKELALWLCRYNTNIMGCKFGEENFSFVNTQSNFRSTSAKYRMMTSYQLNKLLNIGTADEQKEINKRLDSANGWCHGMSSAVLFDKKGIIDLSSNFQNDVNTVYGIAAPSSSSDKHVMIKDRKGTSFPIIEGVINYYQLSFTLWSIMNYREIFFNSASAAPLQPFVNHVTKYGDTLISFYYRSGDNLLGHSIVVYGQPVLSNGYYLLHFYDPNCTTEQTIKISADYSSCVIPHNGSNVVPEIFTYYLDFYSAYSLDIDGDYNEYPYGTASISSDIEYSSDSIQETTYSNRLMGETWLSVDCCGVSSVTNAEGEVLLLECGIPSGNLEILDSRIVPFGGIKNDCPVAYYQVRRSDRFVFDTESENVGFEVIWDGNFQDFTGSGAKQVIFTPESVLAIGSDMNYTLDISTEFNSNRYISISGINESNIRYQNSDDIVTDGKAQYSVQIIDALSNASLLTSNGSLCGPIRFIDLASDTPHFESIEEEVAP